jgi:hypothetical protein
MKTLQIYLISTILIFISSCSNAQNNNSEKLAETMLLDFYSKHFYIWRNTPISNTSPVTVLYEKLDSLMQKYCTSKLRKEVREVFENVGADYLTNNLIGDLNENLKVVKDARMENDYIVSFLATYLDAPGGQTKKQVTVYVTIIKEGEGYKIDSVR